MKKIIFLALLGLSAHISSAPDYGRNAKFTQGVNNWIYRNQQIINNYKNSSLEFLNTALRDLDIFENSFKNIPKTPAQQQNLEQIRQSLNDMRERKKQETEQVSPIPPAVEAVPVVETAVTEIAIQPANRQTFASDLDQWHTDYMMLRHKNYATTSSTAINDIIQKFTAFENGAKTIAISPTEQETLNEIRQDLTKLYESKKRDEEVATGEQGAASEFVTKLDEWKQAIEQLKAQYEVSSLENLAKKLAEFDAFEEASHETKITDQDQQIVNALHEELKKLTSSKRVQQAFSPQTTIPTAARDMQTFNTLLSLWNQIEAVREAIEIDGLICAVHVPLIQTIQQQITALQSNNQALHTVTQNLLQTVSSKLADEVTNKYLTPGACP
jgi:hypothetical protein